MKVKGILSGILGVLAPLIKLITNANDPQKQVERDLVRAIKKSGKLLTKKRKLDKKIKTIKDRDEKLHFGSKLSILNIELARLRKKIRELALRE